MLPINLTIHDPEQAWFWSDRWQELERQAQESINSGRVFSFDTVEDALVALGNKPEDHEE